RRARLGVEALEERALLAATATGVISGHAFIPNNNPAQAAQNFAVPGLSLVLTGTTDQGAPVNATVKTDAQGAYSFLNVLPGTYQVTALPAQANVLPAGSSAVLSDLPLAGGQTVNQDVTILGLDPKVISLRMFLSDSTPADIPLAPAGNGQTGVGP